jgi:hypothetical protein
MAFPGRKREDADLQQIYKCGIVDRRKFLVPRIVDEPVSQNS